MTRCFVFPGQGSHKVGMGKEIADAFPIARHLFEEVDEALKQNLSRLIFNGPDDELTMTENAQPALMAVSLATVRVLEGEGGLEIATAGQFVAGHSLGEYSALAAAGAIDLAATAGLLKTRGKAMQEAVPPGEGAMAALLGLDIEIVEEIVAEVARQGVCAAANDNAAGQVVISGAVAAVERAVEKAGERGAKRSIMLPVSAPFHCALMAPAAAVMAEELAAAEITSPRVPVVANVSAQAETDPDEIRRLLIAQVAGRVRWRESVLYMKDRDVDTLVEVGAGKVLCGLARRIDKELTGISLNTPEDIEAFLKSV